MDAWTTSAVNTYLEWIKETGSTSTRVVRHMSTEAGQIPQDPSLRAAKHDTAFCSQRPNLHDNNKDKDKADISLMKTWMYG